MTTDFRIRTVHYRWAAALWTVGIIIGCSIPPSRLSTVEPALSFDKVAHFGLFAVFAVLWLRGLCPPRLPPPWSRFRRQGGIMFVLGALFAGGTELYQQLLPMKRTGDPYDALADGAGLAVGIGIYAIYLFVIGTAMSKAPGHDGLVDGRK